MTRTIYILIFLFLLAFVTDVAYGQSAGDDRPLGFERRRDEDIPKNVLETREKMRIEREKKDHAEMLGRGEEARKLAERVDRSFSTTGRLSEIDLANLESVEKDLKKIRSDLGGDDDDEKVDDILGPDKKLTVADAVTTLVATTATLFDELKKSTRFTISAAAIQSSNAALRIARFLRFGK